jgi:large subunit ribosomal protein L18
MKHISQKHLARAARHHRIRMMVKGTAERPRLAVFRSLTSISAQIINDETGTTLVAASDRQMKLTGTKSEKAMAVGKALAEKALAANISTIVFDRGGFSYHGRVKALADGAREGGLKF